MQSAALNLLVQQQQGLQRYLRYQFPLLDPASIEDAVSSAVLDFLEHPERLDAALACGGESGGIALLRCVGWRKARGRVRQASYKRETAMPEASSVALKIPPGQEIAVDFRRQFRRMIKQAADACGQRHAPRVCLALEDKFTSGDSDLAVAARHGLPREYINRAKRLVQRTLLETW